MQTPKQYGGNNFQETVPLSLSTGNHGTCCLLILFTLKVAQQQQSHPPPLGIMWGRPSTINHFRQFRGLMQHSTIIGGCWPKRTRWNVGKIELVQPRQLLKPRKRPLSDVLGELCLIYAFQTGGQLPGADTCSNRFVMLI